MNTCYATEQWIAFGMVALFRQIGVVPNHEP